MVPERALEAAQVTEPLAREVAALDASAADPDHHQLGARLRAYEEAA